MFRAWYAVVISAFALYFAVLKDVVVASALTIVLWFYFAGLRKYYEALEMVEKVDKDMKAYKDMHVVELYNVNEYEEVKRKFLKWGKDDHDICLDGVIPKRAVFDDQRLVIRVFEDWEYVLCR